MRLNDNKENFEDIRSTTTSKFRDQILRHTNLLIKRFLDIVIAIFCIVIFIPLLVLIAISIKISSVGPVFFLQERLGKGMKVFKILKFRTMIVDAEQFGSGLFVYDDKDKRITRIGRLLRKTSMDELPQLLNVLRGDMSLVGPRPPVTYFPYKANEYDDFKRKRFEMRPGITGLAQIKVRTTASWNERIKYDVEYVEQFNIFLDIKIFLETVLFVVASKKIYPETPEKIKNQ